MSKFCSMLLGLSAVVLGASTAYAAEPATVSPDRTIVSRNFRADAIEQTFAGASLPNGRVEMRTHHALQPIHAMPVVLFALTGLRLKAAGGAIDYRIYAEPTCTGMGTTALVCTGYDVVAEAGLGTVLESFEGTVMVMNVLVTPQRSDELPGRLE